MRRTPWVVVLATLAIAGGNRVDAGSDAAGAVAAVEELNRALAAAISAGDAERPASFYAADGVLLGHLGRVRTGPADIRGVFPTPDRADMKATFTSEAMRVAGDLVVDRGEMHVVARRPSGDVITDQRRHYVHVLERQADGAWRIVIDIFNYRKDEKY